MAGKEKLASFGAYPEVSLADARKRQDEAREQIAASKDPSREKRRAKVRQRAEAINRRGWPQVSFDGEATIDRNARNWWLCRCDLPRGMCMRFTSH